MLLWDDKTGIGFYPVENPVYDDAYFEEYERREHGPLADPLNTFRINLVNAYTVNGVGPEMVLDVGIGNGAFIRRRGQAFGFDVCPRAVTWLQTQGLFVDPYRDDLGRFHGITFFDSFEHIYWPPALLAHIGSQTVFISLPVFRDRDHVLSSKHFKPREHYWYFTIEGLVHFMKAQAFELSLYSEEEKRIGREDIGTFIFQRSETEAAR